MRSSQNERTRRVRKTARPCLGARPKNPLFNARSQNAANRIACLVTRKMQRINGAKVKTMGARPEDSFALPART
jgi:hypothetical protein